MIDLFLIPFCLDYKRWRCWWWWWWLSFYYDFYLSRLFFSYISHSTAFFSCLTITRELCLVIDANIDDGLDQQPSWQIVCFILFLFLCVWEREREQKSRRKIVKHLFTYSSFMYSKRQKKRVSLVLSLSLLLSLSPSVLYFFFLLLFFDTFGQWTRATTEESCTVQFLYVLLHHYCQCHDKLERTTTMTTRKRRRQRE